MQRGKLRVYLGAAPGVGKTYAMLDEGWRRKNRGTDVVVAYVETHGRPSTVAQIRDLEVVPRAEIEYRGQGFEELDVAGVIARRPAVALVDELAHTNVPGSRNEKRWQDVDDILDAGIDVISTVNIQHLESVNDVVEQVTGVKQRETIPDAIVRRADQIELVDMTPEALRRRMAHGNIYPADKVDAALGHYFRVGNLGALRELALLWVADRVDDELAAYRERYGISQPWETKERVVVALTGAPGSDRLLRRGARMAARVNGELIGVHVRAADGFARGDDQGLEQQRLLLDALGGRYAETSGTDVATALVRFARAENASQLVLGASQRSRWAEFVRGSVINRAVREADGIDVHVISPTDSGDALLTLGPARERPNTVGPRRRRVGFLLAVLMIPAVALALVPLRSSLELPGALLVLLLGVVVVGVVGGPRPAVVAVLIGCALGDFLFTHPYYSLRMVRGAEIIDIVVFAAVAAVVTSLVDRLARREVQALRSNAEAEALVRLAAGGVVRTDEPLSVLVAELRRIFGLDAVAVLQNRDGEWRELAAAGGPVPARPEDASYSAPLADGTVLVLSGATVNAADSRLLAAFVAQLRLAQEHERLEAKAATATQLEEANTLRGALLAAVSHDLRTPLASIKAASTSLLSNDITWNAEERLAFVKTIDSEADRLAHLVANLLDMSRLQAGALVVTSHPTALDDVLYAAVGALGASAQSVVIDVAEELPHVDVDPGLLERVLGNLLDNALAWSPPGSAVRVEAGIAGDHVDIRVIDQGSGIPPKDRDRVFEPFQRLGDGAGARSMGVGLGLAIAKGFIEAMSGELRIDDTPGGGTTMVVSVRRAR